MPVVMTAAARLTAERERERERERESKGFAVPQSWLSRGGQKLPVVINSVQPPVCPLTCSA